MADEKREWVISLVHRIHMLRASSLYRIGQTREIDYAV